MKPRNSRSGPNKCQESLAEKILLCRMYTGLRTVRNYSIPNTRATFLIVFSPDGTKFASTNCNHNVYIVNVKTKTVVKTLSGHRRTPWTLAFHPSNNNIVASGCLDGEVRVWDLKDDFCEVWQSPGRTVIASLTFHPRMKILVIATCQDLFFWDWSTSIVVSHVATENIYEKVRYVKFDSSGDELITAIALKSETLSPSDSVIYREIYQFTRCKQMLRDFQRIHQFFKVQITNCRNAKPVNRPADAVSKLTCCDIAVSNVCNLHFQILQKLLNVSSFCPTDFSAEVLRVLRSDAIPLSNFREQCYLCRYTWLYEAVFKCRLQYDKRKHKCKNEEHTWDFTATRKRELLAENEDEINGLTENAFRYSFERYTRIMVAPHFAHRIPGSVSKKCLNVDTLTEYCCCNRSSNRGKVNYHDIWLRSDCFLDHCEKYNFHPDGSFTSFLSSIVEVYQILASLQQICSKTDALKLNTIMTEWEYLYCKMLLMCRVMEGDDKFMFSEIPQDVQTQEVPSGFSKCENSASTASTSSSSNSHFMTSQYGKVVDEERLDSACETKTECNSCRSYDEASDTLHTCESMKMLKKELVTLTATLSQRYSAETQRNRIQKLYRDQFNRRLDRKGVARTITIQTMKNSILTLLSVSIRELKVLLKSHFEISSPIDQQCRESFIRMVVFVARKMVSFSSIVLDFMWNFDYDVINFQDPLTGARKELIDFDFANFKPNEALKRFDRSNDPVFDEECETAASDLSDDELSSNAYFGYKIHRGESDHRTIDNLASETFNLAELDAHSHREVLDPAEAEARARKKHGVVCSDIYLSRHLKVLGVWGWQVHDRRPRDRDMSMVMNVDKLYTFFHDRLLSIDNSESGRRAFPLYRLQMWDFSKLEKPNISSRTENIIATECKIHNDATIAISHDDLCAAVLLSSNQLSQPDGIGVFSLQRKTLGHVLFAVSLSQVAVSLSFSPTNEHLAVSYNYTYAENMKMADVIGVKKEIRAWRNFDQSSTLSPIVTSIIGTPVFDTCCTSETVNCIRWIPGPGRGLILGTSAGEINCFS